MAKKAEMSCKAAKPAKGMKKESSIGEKVKAKLKSKMAKKK